MKIDRRANYVLVCFGMLAFTSPASGQTAVSISFPGPAPLVLSPTAPTPVNIVVATGTDTVVAGSVALFHRIVPAAFQQVALTPGAANAYSGNLPTASCGAVVHWYVTAEGVQSGTVTAPPGGANAPFESIVGTVQPVVSYDFQSSTGWSVAGGAIAGTWAVGVPVGCNRGDPPADYDGSGSCYLTQPSTIVSPPTCDSDVDNGVTRLVSPVFDLSAHSNPHVRYARWFSNSIGAAPDDAFTIQISQDGGTGWLALETVGPTAQNAHPEVNGGWHPRIIRIADIATNTTAIRFRFSAADQSSPSTVEAGIDAFAIVNLTCGSAGCLRGDMTQDGMIDGRDIGRFTRLLVTGGASPAELCAGDLEPAPDGALDSGDIPAFVACISAGGCG